MRNHVIREIAVPVAVLLLLSALVVVLVIVAHSHGIDLHRVAL